MARLFGTDGVRGTYGDDLTDALARSLGYASASVLGNGSAKPRVLIGRDTRASGPALERALAAGLSSANGEAVSVGVFPTAGVAFLVCATGADAGAVISASHNPARDNGIKFFGSDGMKLPDETEDRIATSMIDVEDALVSVEELADAEDRYVDFLLRDVPSLHGLRMVVDCANGAASNIAPEVYRLAGAEVHSLFADPDGTNINDHCGSTHPELLQQAVSETGAHIGIAHDGDADRCIAIDEHGRVVDGDQILGICASDMHARGALAKPSVVATVMSNLGFRRAMAAHGFEVVETQVGDRYVLQAMIERDISIGGEQSGHIVFRDRHTTGDGILTALQLLGVVARTGSGLSELASRFPRYPQILRNVSVRDKAGLDAATGVWDEVRAVESRLGDGGRVLVRPSGTEPLIRVMVEATTVDDAMSAVDRIARAVADTLG
ncbi:MAG: phosphoglucosamine mutase [Actinomycetota bacterium]